MGMNAGICAYVGLGDTSLSIAFPFIGADAVDTDIPVTATWTTLFSTQGDDSSS